MRSRLVALLVASTLLGACSDPASEGEGAVPKSTGGSGAGAQQGTTSGADVGQAKRPTVAYVTNGVASFWTIAIEGAKAAGRDLDCEVLTRTPGTVADQKNEIQALLTRGVDGMALSMIAADEQVEIVNEACAATNVITHDSDSANTNRLCYVGMDNYVAGRMCGELVREALPDGGELMIFVGRAMQDNARRRRQGVIDAILGRPEFTEFDGVNDVIEGNGFKILGTRTDQFDRQKAKSNAEDAIATYPNLAGMIGLFAYNTPACLEAIKGAKKEGELQMIAFDEADETLQGILDGHVYGTVVQKPFEYGYESVRIMRALALGDRSVIPENGFFDIPAEKIGPHNVQAFWDDLKQKLEGAD